MGEAWIAPLEAGDPESAWDLFIERYRRLIFAAIRHYAEDYDDVMDVFARVCEGLRDDDLRRLRSWVAQPTHRARFSTWLVTVVRNLTIDWFRQRDGRRRLSTIAESLPPLQRRIFELVFLDQHGHVEAFERLRSTDAPDLSFKDFQAELRATYRATSDGRRGLILRELGPCAASEVAEPESPSPLDLREGRAVLEQALGTLSQEDRAAVQLYVQEEMPAAAIARTLGLPNAKAVYNRVYRALAALREYFERSGVRREDL